MRAFHDISSRMHAAMLSASEQTPAQLHDEDSHVLSDARECEYVSLSVSLTQCKTESPDCDLTDLLCLFGWSKNGLPPHKGALVLSVSSDSHLSCCYQLHG